MWLPFATWALQKGPAPLLLKPLWYHFETNLTRCRVLHSIQSSFPSSSFLFSILCTHPLTLSDIKTNYGQQALLSDWAFLRLHIFTFLGFLGSRKVTLGLFFLFSWFDFRWKHFLFSKLEEFGPFCLTVSLLSKSIMQRSKPFLKLEDLVLQHCWNKIH